MTSLTSKQLKDYEDYGFVAPIDVLTLDEANEITSLNDAYQTFMDGVIARLLRPP